MIGKKKTKDVQFYREVTDASYDETGNRRRRYNYGDEDELAAEHEERLHRSQLNKEFQSFAERIQEMSNGIVEVDIPYRRVGFYGVPFRQLVLLQPTTECLVHLTDPPYLVITLSEIEIAHLERVQFGLKNFDLVFVFKDFQRTPIHINTIPMAQLDNVKEWLDSMDIAFFEGPVNLNWSAIMKTINENPAAFFEDGGWKFLSIDTDDEDDMEEEEEESEYELSEEDDYSSSEVIIVQMKVQVVAVVLKKNRKNLVKIGMNWKEKRNVMIKKESVKKKLVQIKEEEIK
jgi:nucleosome binding factor SPN SPT16 subunit